MGFSLYVTCCFSLAAFSILSLCLLFVSLIIMSLALFLLGFLLYGTLHASWTWLTISFSVLGKFSTVISQNFLTPFLFLFFFWKPYNSNVGVFDIVPDISETILSSFHAFYFILLFRSYFRHFIFQLTDSFSASDILLLISSRVFLISIIVLSLYVYSLVLICLC